MRMRIQVLLAAVGLAVAGRASALQPLEDFLRGARSNPDDAEARAARRQLGAEADVALGGALPRLSLHGQYIRNQFETTLQLPGAAGEPPGKVTLTPKDQLDGTATLDVPLVDLARFARIASARTAARAAAAEQASTELRVQAIATQGYYQLVAELALVEASQRALEVARESLRIAEARHQAGSTALLDVDRARAEVERNVQQLASSQLQVSLAARALRSLTGIAPELDGAKPPADDLHEEPPLERFEPPDDELPAIAAAIRGRVAADQQARAQRLALVPSLAASVTERVTSAEGLAGREDSWQAVVGLSWVIDLTTFAGIRAQDAAAEAARAREERVRLAARDDIHRAWSTVRSQLARSRSARIQQAQAVDRGERRFTPGARDPGRGEGRPDRQHGARERVVRAAPRGRHLGEGRGRPVGVLAVGHRNARRGARRGLGAELPGTVREIAFESGTAVRRGQVLVKLDTSAEEAQLDAAVAEASLARLTLQRADRLRRGEANAQADLDAAAARAKQAAATVANLRATIAKKTIRAPFDGRIAIRQVELGQVVSPGTPIASLQSVSPIHADFWLPQQALAELEPGQRTRLHTDAFAGAEWEGEITTVNPEVDPATRNVRVRATFENRDGRLRPGMFANVQVISPEAHDVLVIPATAVMFAPYGDSVFAIEQRKDDAGRPRTVVRQKFVRTGERRGDLVAVTAGLAAGEAVVSSGAFKLRNGTAVAVNDALAPAARLTPNPSEE